MTLNLCVKKSGLRVMARHTVVPLINDASYPLECAKCNQNAWRYASPEVRACGCRERHASEVTWIRKSASAGPIINGLPTTARDEDGYNYVAVCANCKAWCEWAAPRRGWSLKIVD